MNNIEHNNNIEINQPKPQKGQAPEISASRRTFAERYSPYILVGSLMGGGLFAASLATGMPGCVLNRNGTQLFKGDTGISGGGGTGPEGGAGGSSAGGTGGTGGGGGTGLEGGNGGAAGGTGGEGGTTCIPTTEVCDGIDNNCNNAVDEADPELGDACDTGNLGECAAGTKTCDQIQEKLTCSQTNQPQTEVCTGGLDEDCDGLIDCNDNNCINDLACSSSVNFLDSNNCIKVVKFYNQTTNIDAGASTANDNSCSGNISGFFAKGDRAMVWQDRPLPSSTLFFTSTTPPVLIEDKCSTTTNPPDWNFSTAEVQAGGYSASNFSVNGQQFTVQLNGCVKDYYDVRITW